ncbi:hypothetical protein ACPA9J_14210 [Pseudomonas aeruginosa]
MYGFNSTLSATSSSRLRPVPSWCSRCDAAGGNDTLDFSGFGQN